VYDGYLFPVKDLMEVRKRKNKHEAKKLVGKLVGKFL